MVRYEALAEANRRAAKTIQGAVRAIQESRIKRVKRDPRTATRYLKSADRPRVRPTFHRDINTPSSSQISLIRYCPRTRIMDVIFAREKTRYRYWGVSELMLARVICAKSVGRAFNELVRDNELVPYAKMRTPKAPEPRESTGAA